MCRLFLRSEEEYLLIKNIQHQLQSPCNKVILRRMADTSKVFHLGISNGYQQKPIMYIERTCAYEEVKNGKCPLADNLSLVVMSLDKLLKKKAINSKQYSSMIPNKDEVELGHLYFLPKPHKVRSHLFDFTFFLLKPSSVQ